MVIFSLSAFGIRLFELVLLFANIFYKEAIRASFQ